MSTSINPNQTVLYSLISLSRFNSKYVGSALDIGLLASYLSTPTLDFGNLFNSPNEYIVGVKAFPFDLSKLNQGTPMSTQNVHLGTEDTGIPMKVFSLVKPILHITNVAISPKYNYSYLDYAPYTKITMWLPYIGFVELDPNEVMGKVLSIDYAIDLDTGEVTGIISRIDTSQPYVLKTEHGKIAIDIPLGSTNAREMQRNLFTATLGIGSSITSMATSEKGFTTGGVIGGALKTTGNMFNALQVHYKKGSGSLQGLNNLPLPQSVYIIYERNNLVYSPIDTKGKPLQEQRELNELHGYTEVGAFWENLNLGTATKDEVDEIKDLMYRGIYLP